MELPEEHRMLADLVAKFVDRDLMPLEPAVLAREARGEKYGLTRDEEGPLLARCRESVCGRSTCQRNWAAPIFPRLR